jgi:hypothetical protein
VVATVALFGRWPVAREPWRLWAAVFLAWCTHPLLDALSPDTKVPIGIMAFWPLTTHYFNSGLDWFLPISRRCCTMQMVAENSRAMLREVLILIPVVAATWWLRAGRLRSVTTDARRPGQSR